MLSHDINNLADVTNAIVQPDPLNGPFFEETIYVTPSRLGSDDMAAVVAAVDASCRALGLTQGPVHAEVRVEGGRAWVIEVAARNHLLKEQGHHSARDFQEHLNREIAQTRTANNRSLGDDVE